MPTICDQALDGWLVIDKPAGPTSNRVVAQVRRLTAARAGHAGTLDPLATGVLPVALGEARKTVAYAMAGPKTYRFRIRWGEARATDDAEGDVTACSAVRPSAAEIQAALPRFVGRICQTPPAYSAIKIGGRRAYALARAEQAPELAPRTVDIAALRLCGIPDPDHADCEAVVGKGTYIRALARDLGLALGTLAHVVQLRRLAVGRFTEAQAISLDCIAQHRHDLADCGLLLPIEAALDDIPALALTASEAAKLRCGQRLPWRDREERARLGGVEEGVIVAAWHGLRVIALARIENGALRPVRVINC
jgi:tRNA pseudouridine55 synthase